MRIGKPEWRPGLFFVLAAGSFLCVAFQSANAEELRPAAKAPTTEQRLKAVEDKTSYYVKTTNKLAMTFKKGRAGSAPWQCVNNDMILVTDPKIRMAGTSYSWTTATIKFSAVGTDPEIRFSVGINGSSAETCVVGGPIKSATGTYKKFCQVEVEARDKFQFIIHVSNGPDGDLRACDHVASADVELKLVNVGIEEPE